MPGERRRTEYIPLGTVMRAFRNPKGHNAEMIANSISRFGVVEIPTIDERTGRLVAGHGRLDDLTARQAAGEAPPDGIDIDPNTADWLIPVQRGWASRSDADAEAYLVVSNQATIDGGWDDGNLAKLLADLRDQDPDLLAMTGFDQQFITANWDGDTNPWDHAGPPGTDDDEAVPDLPDKPATQPGDVWILGRHRLMCGSSLDPDAVATATAGAVPTVVYADPPYGVSAVPRDGGASRSKAFGGKSTGTQGGKVIKARVYRDVIGDDTTESAAAAFAAFGAWWPEARQVWWGANHYAFDAGLPNATCWLVWDKKSGASDFADCELAWTNHPGAVRQFTHMWNGMLRDTERGERVHPTQKPVALAEWAIGLVGAKDPEGVVFDGFGGSGSTLLAAERLGRAAVVMELDPGYCDVICRRYQETAGTLPVRETDGMEIDFGGAADE